MAKKIVLVLLGLVLFVIGLGIAAVGGVALGFGGQSGVVRSDYHAISTPTSAFVTNPGQVRGRGRISVGGNDATVGIDGRGSKKPLFIGVGPASQVAAYLNGSSYAEVSDVHFGNFHLHTALVPGSGKPAAPGDQSFWVAQAAGASPHLDWHVTDGDYRVVVMNADGSRGVALQTRLALKIKHLFGIGLGAAIVGGMLTLLGLMLLTWGVTTRTRRDAANAVYPKPHPPVFDQK